MAIVEKSITNPLLTHRDSDGEATVWPSTVTTYLYGLQHRIEAADVELFEVVGNIGNVKKISIDGFHGSNYGSSIYIFDTFPSPKDVRYAGYSSYSGIEAIAQYSINAYGSFTANFNGLATSTGKLYIGVLHNQLTNFSINSMAVDCEGDDTDLPPLAVPINPESAGEAYNYQATTFEFGIVNRSGSVLDGGQIQCSYDENDWSNPIVDMSAKQYPADNYQATVNAGTFNPGTVYWRCRAKTAFSEWGSWSQDSFTAIERKAYINNIGFKQGFLRYQDRTKPIAVTWFQVTEGITVTHSVVQYALKEDYNNWVNLGTVEGNTREFTIPANTFPAVAAEGSGAPYGGIKLKIVSYNANGIASEGNDTTWFLTIDSDITVTSTYPRNASLKETEPITVTFYTYEPVTYTPPIDVDFRWRITDGEWQYLNHLSESMTPGAGGGAVTKNTVVIPANTFPGAVIYYQVCAYNQDGVAGDWSSEAYFTTVDKPQISTALTPNGTIEDADEPITFTWATSSQSGEASRGADLQYSRDTATWINFGPSVESGPQIPGNVHEYEAPGHTIPPGSIFWRVRSYNRNMVAGDWSTAVSFVAKAAPTVQDIQATAKPWAVVNWQADDQQTYEVFVDGESLGSYFGTEKQFPLPDYLEDGVHTVGVRVMGSFSLWSQTSETQITIANTQAAALTLTAETAVDTALTWEGGAGDFFIYRDGLMIAHTNAHSFTDRVALGTHEYQVIERLASGDYNASETVTQTPAVPYQHIAALAGGDWIGIPHTLKSQAEPSYQESQETAFNYLSGNDYPTASIGSHRTDIGQYSAVFLYTEETSNRAFLALRGKPVILKTADGEVMIGVLNAWERRPKSTREKKLYTAYTFSLQRIGWEDFIDDTA